MWSRKEHGRLAVEAAEKFAHNPELLSAAMLALVHNTLLDIRDIAEGVDRRLGAAALKKSVVKKVAKKVKK